jgi:hypothetical protein
MSSSRARPAKSLIGRHSSVPQRSRHTTARLGRLVWLRFPVRKRVTSPSLAARSRAPYTSARKSSSRSARRLADQRRTLGTTRLNPRRERTGGQVMCLYRVCQRSCREGASVSVGRWVAPMHGLVGYFYRGTLARTSIAVCGTLSPRGGQVARSCSVLLGDVIASRPHGVPRARAASVGGISAALLGGSSVDKPALSPIVLRLRASKELRNSGRAREKPFVANPLRR